MAMGMGPVDAATHSSRCWTLALAAAIAICGNCNTLRFLVNGWPMPLLPSRWFHYDGVASAQFPQASLLRLRNNPPFVHANAKRRTLAIHDIELQSRRTRRSSQLTPETLLNVRGGAADEVGGLADEDVAEDDIDVESGEESTGDTFGENAMKELRKEWSSIPAVPSIALPIANGIPDDHTQSALADVHDGSKCRTSSEDQPTKAIIIVDGFCPYHGQWISHMAREIYGAAVINVISDFFARYLYQVKQQTDHLSSRMPDLDREEEVEAWSSHLPSSMEICGVYCESDSGLDDAERLGVALGLYPRCHDGVNKARRDKFLMNKVVAEVGGLDVVKQKSCRTLEDAEEFARGLGLGEENDGEAGTSTLVVVKPLRGVASDDVHLSSDLPSLRKAFTKILQSPVFGSPTASKHEQVLVQEFATGVEYAADVVCRDGERKVAALWRYDKRAVNGAPFVYYATELVSTKEGEVERKVCSYIFDTLDALGIRWGLSHVEVIAETSPQTGKIRVRLVEVNCRQHNTDFIPLCNACVGVGYNALDMVLAAYLGNDGEEGGQGLPWDSVPALPTTRAFGAIVHFVSHVEGAISRINYHVLQEMEDLPSVMDMHVYPQFMEAGNIIQKTVDIRSDSGWAHLMNDDEEEFRRDYARLVELQKDMFEVEDGG